MKLHIVKTFLGAVLLLLNTACIVNVALPAPTATATPAPTETPTIVWFPPTHTPSPIPTAALTPTQDLRPGIGSLLLKEDFEDGTDWSVVADPNATVSVSSGSINLSLRSTNDYLLTTRTSPVFTDFYVEITANPSICRGDDEYGLIVRDNNGDHYRLSLTCDGRASAQRFFGDSLTRQTEWFTNRTIPDLAPSNSRLAVWADGSQIRFFINDLYLFSVTDTQIFKGTVGVFVHTSGEGDVSVSFSDLQVFALDG